MKNVIIPGTEGNIAKQVVDILVKKNINTIKRLHHGLYLILTIVMLTFVLCSNISAQDKNQMVRLAKLVIDSTQLESYKALLKEEIETSVRVEPGVITLYAVSEKK